MLAATDVFAMFEALPHRLNRLTFRTLRTSDLESFHSYRSDAAVARFQGWEPMAVSECTTYLTTHSIQCSHAPGTWRQLAVAEITTDSLVGDIGVWLSEDGKNAQVGLTIAPGFQGKGYASESLRGLSELLFSSTPVVEIRASTDARNLSCIAALKRAGFHETEKLRAEYKGELCTEIVFMVSKPIARYLKG